AMYHDIGKIYTPQYFTENQQTGFNMHRLFEPEESAQLIIEHVTRGEALARQYKLPQSFINIIREHHGTTHVESFYRQALKNAHDDASLVDETKFRYPGPKPRTKEAAIIMIADSAEAGMHALEPDKQSEEGVIEHINAVIHKKTEDEQFTHCPLTFEELNQIKRTLIKLLTPRIRVPITPKSEEKHNSEEQIE
nr:Cyclic-di-AMP phosphodiesterase PgpH [Chlamydiota bacterium]